MAENKTKPTQVSAAKYIDALEDPQQKKDCKQLVKMMRAATGERAVMWGPSIVGFGTYHYKYASGDEGDIMIVGFAPRKNQISLYLTCDIQKMAPLLEKLGKHKTGKGCLYIKRLADVDLNVLNQMIELGIEDVEQKTSAS